VGGLVGLAISSKKHFIINGRYNNVRKKEAAIRKFDYRQ
jgi:hypothetical protein